MTVRTAPGEVEVKTIRTHIETGAKPNEDPDKLPSLWEFVDSLTDGDWASGGYRFIIERGRPEVKAEERVYIGDFFEKLTPQEIARRWGGGDYTIWFKIPPKGQQLKYKKLLRVDGPPQNSNGAAGSSSYGRDAQSNDPLLRLVDVLDRRLAQMETKLDASGIGAANEAAKQALLLNSQVFGAALPAVSGALSQISGGGNGNNQNPLIDKLLTAAIERLFSPPPSNALTDKLLSAAIERMLAPPPPAQATSAAAQLAIEAIRVLPAAISEGVKGIEHWHLGEEARARQAAIMRGANPIDVTPRVATPATAAAPAPPPPVNASASSTPAAQPATQGAATVEVNIETIEAGLVRILTNQSYSIEEAAHRAAALMEDLVPGMPDKVASAGEAQILYLFQTRPILQAVPQNPRLTEFIKKFIEVVKTAPVMTHTQPPPNVPPA